MDLVTITASCSGFRLFHAWKKAQRAFTVAIVLGILGVTYVWTGIQPIKLWEKRHHAWTYLFGRKLTDQEIQEAQAMAERMVEVVLTQNIVHELKKHPGATNTSADTASLTKEAKSLAAERLAAMPANERQAMIDKEFHRLLDEKRGGFFPPQTSLSSVTTYLVALLETLAIAIWGSLLAVLWALPASFLAARNGLGILFPGDEVFYRGLRAAAYFITRRLLDFCRGFNEFVMALVFVAVIGLGPFAGVMALAIHTFGILGKVFSEAIEAIDPGQVEAITATGAGPLQVLSFSVLPQVMPQVISYSLLRFESNVRSATILGFCGAGGIGFLMFDKLNSYQYRDVATMMALVILAVTIIDTLCGKVRHRFI
ncbi:MAG: phosphonate ABC transporter, permease protein PhnE [Desulfosoma sp.]|uniref:phosphonate ABC transporter, permease protein PhnE n=1 Tax=Desulfosoma sp. TaxID=2603217 RepID=UPI004048ED46